MEFRSNSSIRKPAIVRSPWKELRRGIIVERDVLREEAALVLREYAESGGEIYNARQG